MFGRFLKYINKHKRLAIVVVVVVIGAIFLMRGRSKPTQVSIYTVKKQEVVKTVTSSGKTTPKSEFVEHAGVAAKIEKIYFDSGTPVTEGAVVLKLDQTSLQASAGSAWNAYLSAKASSDAFDSQINAAKSAVNDKKQSRDTAWRTYMGDNGNDAKQAYKSAESSYQSAVATLSTIEEKKSSTSQGVNAAYSTYLAAQDNLNSGVVKAPASGMLVVNNLTAGQSVLLGQELFSITNFAGTEFTAEVDETDVQYVQPGQKAKVELEGYSEPFEGEIVRIDGKTAINTSGSTIVPTAIRFTKGPQINPILNMSGTATIEVGKETNSPAVPFDAILYDADNKEYVFVIHGDTVEKRLVKLGFEGADYVVVTDGLKEGEKIVTGDTVSKLTNGSKVSANKS